MKSIVLAIATVAALTAPAFAQATSTGNESSALSGPTETKAVTPKHGTMMKGNAVPANGYGAADDNKQSATGGQPGGSAERGR